MKSAYEIAMSRLEAKAPTVKLTTAQKAEIAEIDSLYESRIAERRVFLEGEIRKADAIDAEDLRRQLSSEIARLEEEREEKKASARRSRYYSKFGKRGAGPEVPALPRGAAAAERDRHRCHSENRKCKRAGLGDGQRVDGHVVAAGQRAGGL
jgi:hypothetical protein